MDTKFGLTPLEKEEHKIANKIYEVSNHFLAYSKDTSKILGQHRKIVLLSGRCPSTKFNLVHLKFFNILAQIQKILNCELIIPIATEEVFLRKNQTLSIIKEKEKRNLDIIKKCRFIKNKIRFILNTDHIDTKTFNLALDISKNITKNELFNIFGEAYFLNPGLIFIPAIECAEIINPILEGKNVILISNLAQDVYLRVARKYTEKKGLNKPAAIFYRNIMDLKGGLRTESDEEGALYYEDSLKDIARKINNAFTGGKPTKSEQIENGGDIEICPVYDYLKIFSSDRDYIKNINKDCKKGKILCGHCKSELIKLIKDFKSNPK